MSGNIFTPTNQKRLTNIAVVRLDKKGKRFEIACYKNKVVNWREGTETDISEVLQMRDTVFTNVSKGEVAKKKLLTDCFGNISESEICLMILKNGKMQSSEKERVERQQNLLKEMANIISDKCVDAETGVALPYALIQKAMKETKFNVNTQKTAKEQTGPLIKELAKIISIKRANMRVKVSLPSKEGKKIKSKVVELMIKVDSENQDMNELVMTGLVSPGHVKEITDLVREITKGRGTVEVLCLKDVPEGEPIL